MTTRKDLADVVALARPIVERIVWATVATVGRDGWPRTRLMHPVWRWDGDVPTALVSARPTPLKLAHLAARPAVSCHYWDPAHDTVAIEAAATWVPAEQRPAAWHAIATTPEPVGFDPAIIWPQGSDADDCAFLHLTAMRILARQAGTAGVMWRSA